MSHKWHNMQPFRIGFSIHNSLEIQPGYVSVVCSCSLLGSVSWCGCILLFVWPFTHWRTSGLIGAWSESQSVVSALCDPIDFSLPGSSVHGLLQARILPFPSLGDLSNPGVEPGSPTLQSNSLPSEPPGYIIIMQNWDTYVDKLKAFLWELNEIIFIK